jgi:hypothetical protein
LQAIQIWNEAQEWLKESYYPTGKIYTLVASNTGPVTNQLAEVSELQALCDNTSQLAGCTTLLWDENHDFHSATIFLNSNGAFNVFVVLHEFGHVLGLPDYPNPCPLDDLMCFDSMLGTNPSTLDLYAIHLLASGSQSAMVWLPTNIPYATWRRGAEPIPEFSSLSLMLILVTFIPILLRKRLSGK